jgi:hypothetical protein
MVYKSKDTLFGRKKGGFVFTSLAPEILTYAMERKTERTKHLWLLGQCVYDKSYPDVLHTQIEFYRFPVFLRINIFELQTLQSR